MFEQCTNNHKNDSLYLIFDHVIIMYKMQKQYSVQIFSSINHQITNKLN